MGLMSRRKGVGAEREVAALIRDLTGWDAQRRVRQHDGDSDLVGVPGWTVEVKRHKAAGRAEIGSWWRQTVAQATRVAKSPDERSTGRPVLFYRVDRGEWRAVWPLACLMTHQTAEMWAGVEWTADTTVAAWAAVAREVMR
jgi:Holliday junction resolvase